MPSYRFCRPDDIPYLVRAVNECYDVHFPDAEAMTVERFRSEMKTIDVWPSNSLVASSEDGPVAVLIGTKRPREVLVRRIGVRPGEERRGHALHLLTSLSQKLAVLGPERLIAELPLELESARALFAAAGYRREALYRDWTRPPAPVEPVPAEWLMPVTVDELREHGLLDAEREMPWQRTIETLDSRKGELAGVAVASPERIEAFALYDAAGDALEILAAHAPAPERRAALLSILLRHLVSEAGERAVSWSKVAPDEIEDEVLGALGFEPGARHERVAATAKPA